MKFLTQAPFQLSLFQLFRRKPAPPASMEHSRHSAMGGSPGETDPRLTRTRQQITSSHVETHQRPAVQGLSPRTARTASDPELRQAWLELRRELFPARPDLDRYTIVWSKRPQKRTLASCSLQSKRVTVARELRAPQNELWVRGVLYHEMCHAYLGESVITADNRRRWHGREFKALERRFAPALQLNQWVKAGGWTSAVRSDRAKRAHARRK